MLAAGVSRLVCMSICGGGRAGGTVLEPEPSIARLSLNGEVVSFINLMGILKS